MTTNLRALGDRASGAQAQLLALAYVALSNGREAWGSDPALLSGLLGTTVRAGPADFLGD